MGVRGSGHFKVNIHFTFLLSSSLLSQWNLNTFHETALSSINWNQSKSMFRVYICQDKSKWWNFMLHKKQESYKFKSKHQFVEINSTYYNIWNSYCNFERFFHLWFSDLIDHLISFDMERVSCLHVSCFFFSVAKPLATGTYSMRIWEKLEFELIFCLIYL